MNQLAPLPCPFCGSSDISTDDARDFVSCSGCYTEGPCNPGMGSAHNIEAWNTRASLAQQSAQPVAYMWQHDETGRTGFVEAGFDRASWEEHNPRLAIICPVYRAPIAHGIGDAA